MLNLNFKVYMYKFTLCTLGAATKIIVSFPGQS